MNKVIIGVAVTALVIITGIVVYQFAEQQYVKQKITSEIDEQRLKAYNECLVKEFNSGNGVKDTVCELLK